MAKGLISRRGGGVNVKDADAKVNEVLENKTFYAETKNKKTGTMPNRGKVEHALPVNGTFTIQEGYHNGEGEVTQSLDTKAAETFTPGTADIKIDKDQYLTGDQTIKGDTDLTAGNIKDGVTIFDVAGTFTNDGDIVAGEVLNTKVGYAKGNKITGTMPNRGKVEQTLAVNATYTIPEGYHNGEGTVSQNVTTKAAETFTPTTSNQTIAANQWLTGVQTIQGSANLVAGNIKDGVGIFGVNGTFTNDGDIVAANVLSGKIGYAKGNKITGNIPSKAAETFTPGTSNQTIASGQYLSGAQTIQGNANLVAGNIKTGVSIFGVNGTFTSDSNATAAQILDTRTAFVNGNKVTGTMNNRGAVSHTLAINGTYTIPAGFHNGSGSVTQSVTTKGAQTFTPGTTNQTIAANQWLTGVQTISGSANLVANNIRSGTNIFGVIGTLEPKPTYTASGGTITTYSSGGKNYRVHTFLSSDNFVVTTGTSNVIKDNQVDYLIIAGGGGGGYDVGAGGGAGGYRTTVTPTPGNTAVNPKINVTAQSYEIIVGSGGTGGKEGAGGPEGARTGNNGNNSVALGINTFGGGGGGGSDRFGENGGSGGGGGWGSKTGGTGVSGQGFAGGNAASSCCHGGGGGGASQVGANGANNHIGGKGGDGLPNNLRTGSDEIRAGGGGGGGLTNPRALGGSGGGGNGGRGSVFGSTSGSVNTGSGGGGGGSAAPNGGNGGSGIVIIRYEVA